MFLALRPSPDAIDRFIDQSRALPFSYGPVGLARDAAPSRVDELTVTIGRGAADFERARAALAAWRQFDVGWVEFFPRGASVQPGTVGAVLIRHLGFWSLNGCRVVYKVADDDDTARFGYAYGTLTNHAEAGEELFEVVLDSASEDVTYRIQAVSWPHSALARIGYPITRVLQARFRRDSAEAMRRAIREPEARR